MTLTPIESSHENEDRYEQVEWYVVDHVVLVDAEERQSCVVDVDDVSLIVDREIIDVWDEGNCHDGNTAIDDSAQQGIVVESPGEDAHEQGSQQTVEAQERIAYGHSYHDEDGAQEELLWQ